MTKLELHNLITILKKRCSLVITSDPATNVMTYDEWLNEVVREVDQFPSEYPID